MNRHSYLLKGTFALTSAGILCRIAGFFYKIFLSQTIGAQEIGLFHLCLPLFTLCSAVSSGGIQTILARFTAQHQANNDAKSSHLFLQAAIAAVSVLSFFCAALLYGFRREIAVFYLKNPSCASIIGILALSLLPCALHACITGYFIGRRQIRISAFSQILEQLIKIAAVFFFVFLFHQSGKTPNAAVMALGQLAGELSTALFCLLFLFFHSSHSVLPFSRLSSAAFQLLRLSAPLSASRILLSLFQSAEAALLPSFFIQSGLSASLALSVYGTLTGMVFPLLLFPTVLTSSASTLLLPVISEADTLHQDTRIRSAVCTSLEGALLLGLYCFTVFFLFGDSIGIILFSSSLAGTCIRQCALLCPLLCLGTTLTGILHGFGKTAEAAMQNFLSLALRLLFCFTIPYLGTAGYFAAVISGQILSVILALFTLHRTHSLHDFFLRILPVLLPSLLTIGMFRTLQTWIPTLRTASLPSVIFGGILCTASFLSLYLLCRRR